MALFSFVPNYNLRELQEWKTDVIQCKAKEQRIALRSTPRTLLERDFEFAPGQSETASMLARNYGDKAIDVPLWEDFAEGGAIAQGDTAIIVDTSTMRVGSRIFITDGDKSEVATVQSFTQSAITVSVGTGNSYANPLIMPLVSAYFRSQLRIKKSADDYTEGAASFITDEDLTVTGATPYPQRNGFDVMTDRPLAKDSGTDTHERRFDMFNNVSGPIELTAELDYPVSRQQASWSFDTREALYDFRKWVTTLKGKQGAFYMPRWSRDFVPTRSIVNTDTALYIDAAFDTDYTGQVCIVTKTGLTFATVTGVESVNATENRLLLDTAVGINATLANIEMITRMPLFRSNTDRIEFAFQEAGRVSVKMPVIEVPDGL